MKCAALICGGLTLITLFVSTVTAQNNQPDSIPYKSAAVVAAPIQMRPFNKFSRKFAEKTARVNNVQINYLIGGTGEPLVLLHGFPMTAAAWRKIMPALAEKYTIIAPDLRGMGKSEKTVSGYDKRTVAEDVYQLTKQLGYKRFLLVGHDFGGSTAYALAAQHPAAVVKLVAIECVPAGLLTNEELANTVGKYFGSRAWFQGFHQTANLPEELTKGREDIYLNWLFDAFTVNKQSFPESDRTVYIKAYAAKNRMRAALGYYRSQAADAIHNQESMKTKLTMPVLTIGGDASLRDTTYLALKKAADNVRGEILHDTGHFIPDEQPVELTKLLLQFFAEN